MEEDEIVIISNRVCGDEAEKLLGCSLCPQICARAVVVDCCYAQACRFCANRKVNKEKKCWECSTSKTPDDLVNDEVLREAIKMYKDDSSISEDLSTKIKERRKKKTSQLTKPAKKSARVPILAPSPERKSPPKEPIKPPTKPDFKRSSDKKGEAVTAYKKTAPLPKAASSKGKLSGNRFWEKEIKYLQKELMGVGFENGTPKVYVSVSVLVMEDVEQVLQIGCLDPSTGTSLQLPLILNWSKLSSFQSSKLMNYLHLRSRTEFVKQDEGRMSLLKRADALRIFFNFLKYVKAKHKSKLVFYTCKEYQAFMDFVKGTSEMDNQMHHLARHVVNVVIYEDYVNKTNQVLKPLNKMVSMLDSAYQADWLACFLRKLYSEKKAHFGIYPLRTLEDVPIKPRSFISEGHLFNQTSCALPSNKSLWFVAEGDMKMKGTPKQYPEFSPPFLDGPSQDFAYRDRLDEISMPGPSSFPTNLDDMNVFLDRLRERDRLDDTDPFHAMDKQFEREDVWDSERQLDLEQERRLEEVRRREEDEYNDHLKSIEMKRMEMKEELVNLEREKIREEMEHFRREEMEKVRQEIEEMKKLKDEMEKERRQTEIDLEEEMRIKRQQFIDEMKEIRRKRLEEEKQELEQIKQRRDHLILEEEEARRKRVEEERRTEERLRADERRRKDQRRWEMEIKRKDERRMEEEMREDENRKMENKRPLEDKNGAEDVKRYAKVKRFTEDGEGFSGNNRTSGGGLAEDRWRTEQKRREVQERLAMDMAEIEKLETELRRKREEKEQFRSGLGRPVQMLEAPPHAYQGSSTLNARSSAQRLFEEGQYKPQDFMPRTGGMSSSIGGAAVGGARYFLGGSGNRSLGGGGMSSGDASPFIGGLGGKPLGGVAGGMASSFPSNTAPTPLVPKGITLDQSQEFFRRGEKYF